MNLLSFADELVKLGAVRCLHKTADSGDIPAGMMDASASPPAVRVVPDEAATRTANAQMPSAVGEGMNGDVTQARHPIDRERMNRTYVERR